MSRRTFVRRGKTEQTEHNRRLAIAARQPHRSIASGEDVLDPRLECPLGRLNYIGEISKEEYDAGLRFRDLSFQYLHAIGAPYPFMQCTEGEYIKSGLMQIPIDDDKCLDWERQYKVAENAILGPLVPGLRRHRCLTAVKGVVVYEQAPRSDFELELLKIGLAALAQLFARDGRASKVIPFNRFTVM